MIRLATITVFAVFVFASSASAAVPALADTNWFKNLNTTVTKVTSSPAKYSSKKKNNHEWARKNLVSQLEGLKKYVWQRHSTRLNDDVVSEVWAKAILEQKAADRYQDNLKNLEAPLALTRKLSTQIVAAKSKRCRVKVRKVKPGKTAKSKRKAKRINRQRVREAKRKARQCASKKSAKVKKLRDELTSISSGVEAYRQAFLEIYISDLQKASASVVEQKIRNRAATNENTISELQRATALANRGRKAIGMNQLPAPTPVMSMPNTAQNDFYGMMHGGNMDERRAAASGVGLTRQGIWFADNGRGGIDWTSLDGAFRNSARYGIRSIGVVCPATTKKTVWRPGSKAFSSALRNVDEAVRRYGPNGTFWKINPGIPNMPVRTWEICNEPNFSFITPPDGKKPRPRDYGSMLVRVSQTIRNADRNAIVLLGGLANIRTSRNGMSAWDFLDVVYSMPETRAAFDGVAFHPYSQTVAGVASDVEKLRALMDRNGDSRKSIWITEIGWASHNTGKSGDYLVAGLNGQAQNLTAIMNWFKVNRSRLNIPSVFWYFWRDLNHGIMDRANPDWDSYAGLFDVYNRPKPAWYAWLAATGGTG